MKFLIITMLATLLSACSSTGLFVLNSSLKLGAEHSVTKDLAYGDEPWQKLDLHIPDKESASARPVLLFFYGGSWDSGHKEMYYFVANTFAKRGFIVAIPDYAKYPAARFPDFMYDGAAALAWIKANIAKYQGDPEQIVMAGHSAGAHLGALLLADRSYLQAHDLAPDSVRGFAGLAGPYNFTPTSDTLVEVFGPPERFPNMQLNTFVGGDEPPMLLMHGEADSTVGVLNQTSLENKLKEHQVPVSTRLYPDVGHIEILMSLTPPLTGKASTVEDMTTFFNSVLP